MVFHLYYAIDDTRELHYAIDDTYAYSEKEMHILHWLLRQAGNNRPIKFSSSLKGEVVEIGPMMHFETTESTKSVAICREASLKGVNRVECFRRYTLPSGTSKESFIKKHCDRMTEMVYEEEIYSFNAGREPEQTLVIDLLNGGRFALEEINRELGLALNESKIVFLLYYFTQIEKRNPTDVELFLAAQVLSEHCRHGFFGAKLHIDGVEQKETLFQIVKSIHAANPGNSNSAFRDNASSIVGYDVRMLQPRFSHFTSDFVEREGLYHLNNTAETHNYPTSISAFPGAITGIIGMERDKMAQGKGSQGILAYGGYYTAALHIPGYPIPGEKPLPISPRLETPLDILIKGSNGVVDGANKYGQPVTGGVCRSVDLVLPDGERRAYLKPILYAGGLGMIKDEHLNKDEPAKGMIIVQIGGSARRIGKGGGARSSTYSTTSEDFQLDFDGVQRGDPEMQNGVYRVNRACIEQGSKNPIAVVHDHGAGGPANVLLELVGQLGGRIHFRCIQVGDPTMSALEIVGCEYQERMAYLIYPERLTLFKKICKREGVVCEVLGEITGDGRIVFIDDKDDSTPVNLHLQSFMVDLPQEEYHLERVDHQLKPLVIPEELTVADAFQMVCQQLSVCSKGFLVHKGDQTVGGLVAQQQCCGPMMIPVSDVSVGAFSPLDVKGGAHASGENPLIMLIDPKAGARMTIAEALTNLSAVAFSSIEDVTYRANWMAAAKLPGEGPVIFDAMVSLRDLSLRFKIKPDGGKDSLTMAELFQGGFVKAPATLILSAYVTVPDVNRVATPAIKKPGESILVWLNPSQSKNRLGGSALAQALDGQLGNECPDIDYSQLFLRTLQAIQKLHAQGLILAYHDRTGAGGMAVALAEMAMASNCGIAVNFDEAVCDPFHLLFAEEAGMIIECDKDKIVDVFDVLEDEKVEYEPIGLTKPEPRILIRVDGQKVLDLPTGVARRIWEETSYQLERLQMNPACAEEEYTHYENMTTPQCKLTFEPRPLPEIFIKGKVKPKVAILRTHGTNSDREMAAAFHLAGFRTQEVSMSDLKEKKISLTRFHGLAACGGFADADVFGSAKGWAASVIFDERLKEMFEAFYRRPDSFSFSECNGCQFAMLLGWATSIDLSYERQPRMVHNRSGRFEHRWPMVKILPGPAIMFKGMEGSQLVIPSAHGEGRFYFPDPSLIDYVFQHGLAPVRYVDPLGNATEKYPYNPNGSPNGIAALCSSDGRHLAMMPHPTRSFTRYQCNTWLPEEWKKLESMPWLQMFQNARFWLNQS